jgi:hypothetical protein
MRSYLRAIAGMHFGLPDIIANLEGESPLYQSTMGP